MERSWIFDILHPLDGLNREQKYAFWACFLGWTLDAFDFFVLVFVVTAVAREFNTDVTSVTYAIQWTLMMRPVGALVFGVLADRYGRRLALVCNVVFYSVMEFLSGFAPTLTALIVLRALYGIGMGGEWGVGASLAMESVPPRKRGILSGILQEGYVVGYMLAALVYWLVFPVLGWRWMFFLGLLPAPIVLLVRTHVREPEAWHQAQKSGVGLVETLRQNWKTFLYVIALMTCFNLMSHGTQDLYPTFLQKQPGLEFGPRVVSTITIVSMTGAFLGGMFFGGLSERVGRRRAIVTAALLGLPMIPLWVFSSSAPMLATGAFLIQFMVQGAWGVIPAHLNELSPPSVRGTFPGFTYQLGNLFASVNAPLQAGLASRWGGNYGLALALSTAVVLLLVAVVTSLGREARGMAFVQEEERPTAGAT